MLGDHGALGRAGGLLQGSTQHPLVELGGRARWADAGVPADDATGGGGGDATDCDDDDAPWEEDWEEEQYEEPAHDPEPWELRAMWQQECKVVRTLEAQGAPADSAALAAARAARDDAEQRWRRAKEPHPVSTRIGWAQKRLDKAEKALTKIRYEVEEYEESVQRRRRAYDERIEAAEQRFRWRRDQLEELHAEAAGASNTRASSELCDMLATEVTAMVEVLEEGSKAREMANLLLSRIADASKKPRGGKCENYDIADDDAPADADDETMHDLDDHVHATMARGAATTATGGAAMARAAWSADATGRWQSYKRGGGAKGGGAATARAVDGTHGKGGAGAAASGLRMATKAGEQRAGQEQLGAAAPQSKQPLAGEGRRPGARGREEDDVEISQPNKSHRGEDDVTVLSVECAGDDLQRARKLQQEQEIAMAAARDAQATFGDATSVHIAAQLYAHKVALAVQRANAVGIGTMVDGKQLIELAPEVFAKWTTDVLAPAEAEAKEDDRGL